MNANLIRRSARTARAQHGHLWGLMGWFTVAAVLLLTMGARADVDDQAKMDAAAAVASVTTSARTTAEREWNEREDLKAGGYVGQPGVY